jgi:uncharacterized protein DUF5715/transglycosylase-like protein with SLT domain
VVRRRHRIRWLLALVVAAAAVAAAVVLLARGGDERKPPTFAGGAIDPDAADPFAWTAAREDELVARATAGHSHVLYEKSPGGVAATARRVERWRPQVEAAAATAGVDPDVVEGMVFLESAGRPDVMASDDLEGAVGLTQILAETGSGLLGMHVDVAASRRLTRKLRRAEHRGDLDRIHALRARRRRVDERFDPDKALAATGRYLRQAYGRFGRDDLAVESYHMGMGNLQTALSAYGAADPSYAQLYFDATPDRSPRTQRILAALGDDSATYLWRVLAAKEIMRLYREDPAELERRAALQTAKASAEEVLHPADETDAYADPDALAAAYDAGELRPFPNEPRTLGLRRDPRMGELARRLDAERALYRGLRPEAYALAAYIGARVRALAHTEAPLIVTSTVRDRRYQDALARRNVQATHAYSLHTTGYALDVERRYRSRAQAVAFQYVLDRLQSLNLIAWVREPDAIHITVSSDARRLERLLR